jgi:hypothetical protein
MRFTFWTKFYAKLSIPLFLMLAYMLRWSILRFREHRSFLAARVIVLERMEFIFVVSVSIFFSIIFSTLLSPFDCVIQKDGSYSLWSNASILCYDDEWYAVHLPFIVIFGLFYVVTYVCIMVKLFVQAALRSKRSASEKAGASGASSFDYLTRYYKDSVYWWEAIHTLKRILVLSVGKLGFTGDQSSKYFSTFFLLLFFLLLEVTVFPYSRTSLMRLSLLWNAIALLLLITDGLLFNSTEISGTTKDACAFSLIALVMIVLLLSAYHILKTRWTHSKARRFKSQPLRAVKDSANILQAEFQVDKDLYDGISSNEIKGETEIKVSWKIVKSSSKEQEAQTRASTAAISLDRT